MATWGTGVFDDDMASDWLDDFLDQPGADFLSATLAVSDESGLAMADGIGFLCAAEVVCGVLGAPRKGLPAEALRAIAWLSPQEIAPLRALASRKARRVLADDSQLRMQWAHRRDFAAWRDGVLDLCKRLEGEASL
jgi:hypothetical protein